MRYLTGMLLPCRGSYATPHHTHGRGTHLPLEACWSTVGMRPAGGAARHLSTLGERAVVPTVRYLTGMLLPCRQPGAVSPHTRAWGTPRGLPLAPTVRYRAGGDSTRRPGRLESHTRGKRDRETEEAAQEAVNRGIQTEALNWGTQTELKPRHSDRRTQTGALALRHWS